jgi:hypothetical protein
MFGKEHLAIVASLGNYFGEVKLSYLERWSGVRSDDLTTQRSHYKAYYFRERVF